MEMTNNKIATKADFSAVETRMKVSGCIGTSYVIGGLTRANNEDFDILLDMVMEELARNYNDLALSEVKTALLDGAKGRYGDYFGINLKTIIGWLDEYLMSDARKAVIAARNIAYREQEKLALPPRDSDRELRESVNRAFARYCSEERAQAPAAGTIGSVLRQTYGAHDLSSPLLDIGKPKENFCNRHGIKGTLAEIFARFKAEGRTKIFE